MELQIIQKKIYDIRGKKVMLDFDLAELYEVETRALNQAVKRNIDIFPYDFMFQLTKKEWRNMSSQIVMTYPVKHPKLANLCYLGMCLSNSLSSLTSRFSFSDLS